MRTWVCEPRSNARRFPNVNELFDEGRRSVLARRIDEWLAAMAVDDPAVQAVDRTGSVDGVGDQALRWYVRLRGVDKEITTIWFSLGQRTLRYETYVMPAPEENPAELYEHVLRRNEQLVGAHYSIGVEDAVFLRGELALALLDQAEMDRIIGTLYAEVERSFRTILRIGFASRFRT
jgi:hypothetical protein